MKLSIIIVSYNTKEILKKCLFSLKNAKAEIIVVDNNSEDSSVDLIKKDFPEVKLIQNKENLGFARANNQGIRMAQGEYVLLLNSDTQANPGALEELIKFAEERPEAGVIGTKLLNQDGSTQPSVFRLPTIAGAVSEFWFKKPESFSKYAPKGKNPIEVEAVVGAAMLIPKTVIEKVGLLDERYFMYFEDLDYCRLVRRAGFKVYYLPSSEIVHYHGASGQSSEISYHYLTTSSKIYHGILKYFILTSIIWLGMGLKRFFRK